MSPPPNKLDRFSYDSDLNSGSLQVREARIIAELILRNPSEEIWTRELFDNNRLQKKTPATIRRTSRALRSRLERLDPEFLNAMCYGDDDLATQIAFAAALERNLLLVEFIETCVRDAYLTQAQSLELWQWLDFLDERAQRDTSIQSWTDGTKRKMGQVILRMLNEVGLIDSTRNRRLRRLLVRPELRQLLEDTHRHRILTCMDVSAGYTNQRSGENA